MAADEPWSARPVRMGDVPEEDQPVVAGGGQHPTLRLRNPTVRLDVVVHGDRRETVFASIVMSVRELR